MKTKIGRNADTGRFTPVKHARKHDATHVVETITRKGHSPKKK